MPEVSKIRPAHGLERHHRWDSTCRFCNNGQPVCPCRRSAALRNVQPFLRRRAGHESLEHALQLGKLAPAHQLGGVVAVLVDHIAHPGPDGDVGLQIYASTYRLHFGHFGGLPVKILYAILGLGMCFLCATGMNIWFRRQQQGGNTYPKLERSWLAVVWGFPLAVAITLLTDFWWSTQLIAVFWMSSAIILGLALVTKNRCALSVNLRIALIITVILIIAMHIAINGQESFSGASFLINSLLAITAILLGVGLKLNRRDATKAAEMEAIDISSATE